MQTEEVNYKKNFCQKYFDRGSWDLDVLNQVDVLLKGKKGEPLLYIESKFAVTNESAHRKALAQVILTNKKQSAVLSRVALIYQDADGADTLELVDCSENSVMYNNDINWRAEKPSMPTKDAIDRINDRLTGRVTVYKNAEIKEFYKRLKAGSPSEIEITEKNFNVVYSEWKMQVLFREKISDEQDLINLFLVDILNGTTYKKTVMGEGLLAGTQGEMPLIREGTDLARYKIMYTGADIAGMREVDGIKYSGEVQSAYYTIADSKKYVLFWKKYTRPPEREEFLKILERSATLYSEKYRRDTGGEYTPYCFVAKQNEILAKYYNLNDFIVVDPCAGVGNLENQFGKDFKAHCYLSTLERMDVDICRIKGFENAVQFDFLRDAEAMPKWKHGGTKRDITEIARREGKRLMVVMNPPYQKKAGFKNNLAIEFFNKVLKWQPDVIVFYYMTESFLRGEIEHYIKSGYKIVSHIFSNAKTTFQLSRWAISQIIFDKYTGGGIYINDIPVDRYELEKGEFIFKGTYHYDNSRPNLIDEIDKKIKANKGGFVLGNFSYMNVSINLTNKVISKQNPITTENLKWCLLSKGINFNTDDKYFERNQYVYRGTVKEIPEELFADSIMMSLFYLNCAFTNKGQKNYIMPFTAQELDCAVNDLNVLYPADEGDLFGGQPFDFRVFFSQFSFSKEARALYAAALEVFRFYHASAEYERGRDFNDSFYDITNAIMGKDVSNFKTIDAATDRRITRTKTTKGTKGFGRATIKYAVSSGALPIFTAFFDARDVLAHKINRELLDAHLLLWERENVY